MKLSNNLKVLLVSLSVVIMMTALIGTATAGSITVDSPNTAAEIGVVTTIPVTIHGADDVAGFTINVYNNITGTQITINDDNPLDKLSGSLYVVNSELTNEKQSLAWFVSDVSGIQGDEVLFYVDVLPSVESPASVPITIEVSGNIYTVDRKPVTDEYPVITSVLTVNGSVGVDPSAQSADPKITNVPTKTPAVSVSSTPAVSTTVETVPVTQSGVPIPEKIETATETPIAIEETHEKGTVPLSTATRQPTASSSPLSPVGIFAVLCSIVCISVFRRKDL